MQVWREIGLWVGVLVLGVQLLYSFMFMGYGGSVSGIISGLFIIEIFSIVCLVAGFKKRKKYFFLWTFVPLIVLLITWLVSKVFG